MTISRRRFLQQGAAAGLLGAAPVPLSFGGPSVHRSAIEPVVIASMNGNWYRNGGKETCVELAWRLVTRRAAGRKRLRWALVAGVVIVLVVAALAVLGSSLFAIDDVRVQGAVNTDAARLQAVVDELEGTPVLRADTDQAERDLEAIPWVADARVTTQFPHGATIELRERVAGGHLPGPRRALPRHRHRRPRARRPRRPAASTTCRSRALTSSTSNPGQFAAQGFIAAANLVQALTPELRAMATSAAVTGNGSDLRLALHRREGGPLRPGPRPRRQAGPPADEARPARRHRLPVRRRVDR